MFGERVIDLAKSVIKNPVTISIINQLVRSGTSVGANCCEADCAESKKDFEHKIGLCKKEAKESRYWLRMLARAEPVFKKEAQNLWREANELQLIFITIIKNSKNKI